MSETWIPAKQFYRRYFPRGPDGRPAVSEPTWRAMLREAPYAVRFGRNWYVDPERWDTWIAAGGGGSWKREGAA